MDERTRSRINELLEELYKLVNPEVPEPVEAPVTAPITPIRPDDEEVELEGVIGRPEFKTVSGKKRFTAGLGIQEGNLTQWVSLVAWGNTATAAQSLQRGNRVRVVGKQKSSPYVDSQGVMQQKQELVARVISPVFSQAAGVISANTLSRDRRNGTT